MRTDAVNLSEFAINAIKEQITKEYGPEYSKVTHYATKSKGAQEAHECIRPTHMENHIAGSDASEKKTLSTYLEENHRLSNGSRHHRKNQG